MSILLAALAIAIVGAIVNLYVARASLAFDRQPTIRAARALSIPSLVDHDARMLPSDDVRWMQTFTGRKFYPLAPKAKDVDLRDIAHGLAMTCRYGGHSRQFYSVAEHCVLVSEFVEVHARNAGLSPDAVRNLAQLGLMHDSAEAYIGDMVRPLKHQPEMSEFRLAEAQIEDAIAAAFDLKWGPGAREAIKSIDDRILVDEIDHLMTHPELYIRPWLEGLSPLGARLHCWIPEIAEKRFMLRYQEVFQ